LVDQFVVNFLIAITNTTNRLATNYYNLATNKLQISDKKGDDYCHCTMKSYYSK